MSSLDVERFFEPGLDDLIIYLGNSFYLYSPDSLDYKTDLTTSELAAGFRANLTGPITRGGGPMPSLASRLSAWTTGVLAIGKLPAAYEGGFHPANYTSDPTRNQRYIATFAALKDDSINMEPLSHDLTQLIMNVGGGPTFWYQGVDPVWGQRRYWLMTSDPAYVGHLRALNGK